MGVWPWHGQSRVRGGCRVSCWAVLAAAPLRLLPPPLRPAFFSFTKIIIKTGTHVLLDDCRYTL